MYLCVNTCIMCMYVCSHVGGMEICLCEIKCTRTRSCGHVSCLSALQLFVSHVSKCMTSKCIYVSDMCLCMWNAYTYMRMWACVFVCLFHRWVKFMDIHMYTHIHVHILSHTYIYIYTHTCTYTWSHMYIQSHIHVHVLSHTYMYIHLVTHTCTYTYSHIHVHILSHTYMYISTCIYIYTSFSIRVFSIIISSVS